MKAGGRRGEFEGFFERVLNNKFVQGFCREADFFEGGRFGFVSYGDFGEVSEGGEGLFLAFFG